MATLKTNKEVPQLHVSAISTHSRCGEQFRRAYIEGEKSAPGVAAVVGTATDLSVTANLKNKILKGVLLSEGDIQDIARDGLHKTWDRGVILSKDQIYDGINSTKNEAISKAVRLATVHHRQLAPIIKPTHVQREWTLDVDGYPFQLAGTIDVQEGSDSIRDTKTSAKQKSQQEADNSLQLTMYALAINTIDGGIPKKLTLDNLVDTKVPKSIIVETTRSVEDFDPLFNRIAAVSLSMEKGVFTPANIDDPLCSPKFCGYYGSCKYVRRLVSETVTINL